MECGWTRFPISSSGMELLAKIFRKHTRSSVSCAEHVDEKFPGRVLLAETNQWPEEAASYFGEAR